MTESDWLAADNPFRLFQYVRTRLVARKLQLLACGCCRLLDPLLTDTQRAAIEVVERHADGFADRDEYQRVVEEFGREVNAALAETLHPDGTPLLREAVAQALLGAVGVPGDVGLRRTLEWVEAAAAREVGRSAAGAVRREMARRMCGVFHEVVGNPFRERVVAGPEWLVAGRKAADWMLRVSETARAIALGVQADQAFDRLPILADALEDDGCADAELLAHLRYASHHLRGCWALDLVLGKS